jgi:hypothetical protein
MKIQFSPQRRDDTLVVVRSGDTLTVNGEEFDLSRVGEGEILPAHAIASEWFVGPVSRVNGEIELTLLLPLPVNYSQEQAFPEPLLLTRDGPVDLPPPLPAPEATQEPDA